MERLRKYKCSKPHKKNFSLNPWPLHSSIWGANIHQERRNQVIVAIESPVDSQESTEITTDSVIENNEDDNDEENWSDFTNDLDDLD